jgi:hypothetical protein
MCVIDALGVNSSADARDGAIREMMDGELHLPVDLLQKAADAIAKAQEATRERRRPSAGGPRKMTPGDVALCILGMNVPPGRWGAAAISTAQANALTRFGIEPTNIDRHQASALLGAVIPRIRNGMASVAQLKVVKKLGLPIDVTRAQASAVIDLAKANRWKLTSDQIAQVLDVGAT